MITQRAGHFVLLIRGRGFTVHSALQAHLQWRDIQLQVRRSSLSHLPSSTHRRSGRPWVSNTHRVSVLGADSHRVTSARFGGGHPIIILIYSHTVLHHPAWYVEAIVSSEPISFSYGATYDKQIGFERIVST